MNLRLLLKTVCATLAVTSRVRNMPWPEIRKNLESLNGRNRRKLTGAERAYVFRWSRRIARRLSKQNVCLICSLTLLELDGAPLELHLGLYPQGTAHAWIRFENECLTTDQNLPRDSSLVFKNKISA